MAFPNKNRHPKKKIPKCARTYLLVGMPRPRLFCRRFAQAGSHVCKLPQFLGSEKNTAKSTCFTRVRFASADFSTGPHQPGKLVDPRCLMAFVKWIDHPSALLPARHGARGPHCAEAHAPGNTPQGGAGGAKARGDAGQAVLG